MFQPIQSVVAMLRRSHSDHYAEQWLRAVNYLRAGDPAIGLERVSSRWVLDADVPRRAS